MKKAKTTLILLLFVLLLSGCAFNSEDDVKHLTQEEMTKYVQDRIGEEVTLVSAEGDENGNGSMEYVFKIVPRDIDFEVYASKWVSTIDGAPFGFYELSIGIGYTEGIKKHYKEESSKLAEEYNVGYEIVENARVITITVSTYKDIDNVADFIIALDRLYAYELTDKYAYESAVTIGPIVFSGRCSIYGLTFSRDSSSRIDREALKEEIIEKYIHELKRRGEADKTIPKSVWNSYGLDS